ncbi:hypothetical protein ACI7YQ_12025 [Alteromonas marina]|uniref:hypothetical protein n=1 Tax=unclassified Alteromonas TaxID=2614992 RepID=UPI0012E5C463|nr:hypothetical protein [Alteromonas sp. KUL150]GFD74942.1 hypothetical protein KUL113_43620 [Tenacibaculum sp. KUL113]GFD84383.1 hypothetical protein KUL150_04420 [Alteromonas sp. KUL150]
MKFIRFLLFVPLIVTLSKQSHADYLQGCDDPEYLEYIEQRFAYLESRNRRLLNDTLQDYQRNLSNNSNPYKVLNSLSRHIKYSAQFEPIEIAELKIERAFDYANKMSIEQQIAGDVYDGFSSENHYVDIARAWIAYRKGNVEKTFYALHNSINDLDSALLSAFGPDFDLVRQLYNDGYVEPVVTYIKKTESFWTGKRPDALRGAWLGMINAGCKIQFDSIDTIKAEQLGIGAINVQKALGLD